MKHAVCLIFLVLFSFTPASSMAQGNVSLFENRSSNEVEPINMAKITKIFPQIMHYGYAGKVLVTFDIDLSGVPHNTRILEATRKVIFDGAAEKLVNKFRFEPGHARQAVPYEITFCLKGDRITPVLCDIQFERIGGPADPKVTVYSIPYYNTYAVRKAICGNVVVRFNVDKAGLVQKERIVSSSRPGQFEISLKRSLVRFRFEKGNPQKGIEYKVSFSLPGRCKAP
ncbi:MAG: TonB family protein [Proteobacteria bacterium]|nr:TonB family protein [Pseudomonadota bacterium]